MRRPAPTRTLVRHGDKTAWLEYSPDDSPRLIMDKTVAALRAVGMAEGEIRELLDVHAARLGRRH